MAFEALNEVIVTQTGNGFVVRQRDYGSGNCYAKMCVCSDYRSTEREDGSKRWGLFEYLEMYFGKEIELPQGAEVENGKD